MRRAIPCAIAAGLSLLSAPAIGQQHKPTYAIKGSETIDLYSVYWIQNCKSILKSFGGIDVLQGPSQVTLALREQPVNATRQHCRAPVKGAVVTATGKGITQPSTSDLTFRVRYNTTDGPKQSVFTVEMKLFP